MASGQQAAPYSASCPSPCTCLSTPHPPRSCSPYKWKGPGGSGRPAYVHVLPCPDVSARAAEPTKGSSLPLVTPALPLPFQQTHASMPARLARRRSTAGATWTARRRRALPSQRRRPRAAAWLRSTASQLCPAADRRVCWLAAAPLCCGQCNFFTCVFEAGASACSPAVPAPPGPAAGHPPPRVPGRRVRRDAGGGSALRGGRGAGEVVRRLPSC